MCAHDVLAYIGWVEGLLAREAWRLDPTVEWQEDLSWAQWGIPLPEHELAPGEWVANVDLATELYWPGAPPDPTLEPETWTVAP